MKISYLKAFAVICLVICISFKVKAQNEILETEIKQIMQDREVVGLSVAVVNKGEIIYSKSFGSKNLAEKVSLSNNDLFRIASISKSFSATAIMQLVEAGKMTLNDDFSDLIGFKIRNPKYPEKVITLKMVLSHTSSINDSEGYFNLDAINPAKNANWAKCYNDYEPGKGYEYCNLNFNMIGAVIEKYSGERFDNYIKNHILEPLNLYGGYCIDSLDHSKFATLYEYNPKITEKFTASPSAYHPRRDEIKNYTLGYTTPIFSPTGGMKISASDLAKYMTMHMYKGSYKGTKIISKKSAKIMQTKLSDEENYGLALLQTTNLIDGKLMIGHTGSAYGLYSVMFFNPKEEFGIVAITNGCNPINNKGFIDALRKTVNSLYTNLIMKK